MPTTLDLPRAGSPEPRLFLHDHEPEQASFLDAVLKGLSGQAKAIPHRFLYDQQGSELFDAITRQAEYYPTRTERRMLRAHAEEIAGRVGPDAELIELGSGSSDKVRLLLDALRRPGAYVPIDISGEHLAEAARRIATDYPRLEVHAVTADYSTEFDLPRTGAVGRRLAFYPGSTIGNFGPGAARDFLALWARRLGGGAAMLIGVDLKKSAAILNAAYDDAAGVTAAFSLNLLARANRELGADFDLEGFRHEAEYIEDEGRVAIHLRSLKDQTVTVADRRFDFAAGERLHVEDSWKFSLDDFRALSADAGYRAVDVWTDPERLFSVHLLEVR